MKDLFDYEEEISTAVTGLFDDHVERMEKEGLSGAEMDSVILGSCLHNLALVIGKSYDTPQEFYDDLIADIKEKVGFVHQAIAEAEAETH